MKHFLLILLFLLLLGCDRKRELEMTTQFYLKPYQASPFYLNQLSSRPLIEGTVPRNWSDQSQPPLITSDFIARGKERYEIFCIVCHGVNGDGEGMIPSRGFVKPPSFHSERLLLMPATRIFKVITHGYGAMYSFGQKIPPRDRWAISFYIKAFQHE